MWPCFKVWHSSTHLSELPFLLLLRLFGFQWILKPTLHLHTSRVIRDWKRRLCGLLTFDWIIGELNLINALSCPVISSFLLPKRKRIHQKDENKVSDTH